MSKASVWINSVLFIHEGPPSSPMVVQPPSSKLHTLSIFLFRIFLFIVFTSIPYHRLYFLLYFYLLYLCVFIFCFLIHNAKVVSIIDFFYASFFVSLDREAYAQWR